MFSADVCTFLFFESWTAKRVLKSLRGRPLALAGAAIHPEKQGKVRLFRGRHCFDNAVIDRWTPGDIFFSAARWCMHSLLLRLYTQTQSPCGHANARFGWLVSDFWNYFPSVYRTGSMTDWLTHWSDLLTDWPTRWLTRWPTDWLDDQPTDWMTYRLFRWLTNGLDD